MAKLDFIYNLGFKNQQLLSEALDFGDLKKVRQLKNIDACLWNFAAEIKAANNHVFYIWRTHGDDKVRPSHAANDGRIFALYNPPATGNPGEDFNCRCWAEPLTRQAYANQTLITTVKDSPNKWRSIDFLEHYNSRSEKNGYTSGNWTFAENYRLFC
jgi:hypothetical protein